MTVCAFCRRSLLAGERFRFWRSPSRRGRPLCALCERRAAADGWVADGDRQSERVTALRRTVIAVVDDGLR